MGALNACQHTKKATMYYIALNIAPDNSHRVFPDGTQFDYRVHGPLYEENDIGMPRNCPQAYLEPFEEDKLQIYPLINCGKEKSPYICYKPKKSPESEAVLSDAVGGSSAIFVFGALLLFALFGSVCFLLVQNKRLKSKFSQQTLSWL